MSAILGLLALYGITRMALSGLNKSMGANDDGIEEE